MATHGVNDGLTEKKELDIMSLRKMYVNSLLIEKTCRKCEKTFPRNKEYFYPRKEINGFSIVTGKHTFFKDS